jgi:hypothetical protein
VSFAFWPRYCILRDWDPPTLTTVVGIEDTLIVIPEDSATMRRRCVCGLVHIARFVFIALQPNTELGFLRKPCGKKSILTVVNYVLPFVAIDVLSG